MKNSEYFYMKSGGTHALLMELGNYVINVKATGWLTVTNSFVLDSQREAIITT